MSLLPKPKEPRNQILIFLSGIFLAILVGYYVLSQVDLIPDALSPLGYLDDIILGILTLFFAKKLFDRLRGRYSKTAAAYKELWRQGNLFAIFAKPKTWLIIFVIAISLGYIFWSIDVIPDMSPLGFVDDAIAAIAALIAVIRLYNKK